MSTLTGPYLMPDGKHLSHYLRSDKDSDAGAATRRQQARSTKRGKDIMFSQIMQQHSRVSSAAGVSGAPGDSHELAELRALEAAGVRRRRRWFNDRLLRQMAGPMTVADMERQFKPVPFGWREPSALEVVSRPEHAHVWEGFRSIDADRQQRLLERWEAHNKATARAGRGANSVATSSSSAAASQQGTSSSEQGGAGSSSAAALRPGARGHAATYPAQLALSRWGQVTRKGRAALRKANVHSVMALEMQLLEFMEAGCVAALTLPGLDAWGRLLVHALADFYGLAASTTLVDAATLPASATSPTASSDHHLSAIAEDSDGSTDQQTSSSQQAVISVWHRAAKAEGAVSPIPHPDVTCTDILLAMAEAQAGSISAQQLHTYVRKHIHGSEAGASDAGAENWVLV